MPTLSQRAAAVECITIDDSSSESDSQPLGRKRARRRPVSPDDYDPPPPCAVAFAAAAAAPPRSPALPLFANVCRTNDSDGSEEEEEGSGDEARGPRVPLRAVNGSTSAPPSPAPVTLRSLCGAVPPRWAAGKENADPRAIEEDADVPTSPPRRYRWAYRTATPQEPQPSNAEPPLSQAEEPWWSQPPPPSPPPLFDPEPEPEPEPPGSPLLPLSQLSQQLPDLSQAPQDGRRRLPPPDEMRERQRALREMRERLKERSKAHREELKQLVSEFRLERRALEEEQIAARRELATLARDTLRRWKEGVAALLKSSGTERRLLETEERTARQVLKQTETTQREAARAATFVTPKPSRKRSREDSPGADGTTATPVCGPTPAGQPPRRFHCCLTGDLLQEPVLDRCGHSFERAAIVDVVRRTGCCPVSNNPLSIDCLFPNEPLREEIEEWTRAHNAKRQRPDPATESVAPEAQWALRGEQGLFHLLPAPVACALELAWQDRRAGAAVGPVEFDHTGVPYAIDVGLMLCTRRDITDRPTGQSVDRRVLQCSQPLTSRVPSEVTGYHLWDRLRPCLGYLVPQPLVARLQTLLQSTFRHPQCGSAAGASSHGRVQVQRVLRVENPTLWRDYARACLRVKEHNLGHRIPPISSVVRTSGRVAAHRSFGKDHETDGGLNEVFLFHGTQPALVDRICMYGFDERVARSGLYGQGTYFTDEACKATQYAPPTDSGERVLFYSRVCLGHVYHATDQFHYPAGHAGWTNPRRPPERSPGLTFDSVFGDRPGQEHHEFILFDRAQIYPAYVVYYTCK